MALSVFFHIITWSVLLCWTGTSHATQVISSPSLEGSGYWEPNKSNLQPSPSVLSPSPEPPEPTAVTVEEEDPQIKRYLLTEVVDFLQENLFLILVITCLLVIIIFLICSAVVLSQRRKTSSYYPCSFPASMYVNEMDKMGGMRLFSEVPEKVSGGLVEEPVCSANQLQEDIILATRNLRTPTKAPWREEKDGKPANIPPGEEEKRCVAKEESGGNFHEPEEKKQAQHICDKAKEETGSGTFQDATSVCHMENRDPSSSDLSPESEYPSGSDELRAQRDTDKQEVPASATPFISEEKTVF
ncbi:transmembrane protein 119b [Electrophorus electricus]|uniref:Transmembrane protein 119b n=1 Tax=Electrophorus electricus TaxID=8005 RepID=A0A4W4GSZ1_ELEEL|nr:transmembrane protein 119b [Electrophorus electricus]XP_035383573.1 transmembrane protein 119b [Electrophorus electricus]